MTECELRFRPERKYLGIALLAWTMLLAPLVQASDWPNWRGPNHDGSSGDTGLPAAWSAEDGVLWATPMPGSSSATPIVSGNRVFVSSNGPALKTVHGLCLDRDTGAIVWRKQFAEVARQPARNTLASPSPVTDGERVFFMFGTSDLIALTFDGEELWSKNLNQEFGPIGQQFGYSSSPLLYKDRLYLSILRGQWESGAAQNTFTDKDSYLVCLDSATGELVWKTHRPTDAKAESFDSYGSPIPYESGPNGTVVVQGGDYLTGHDALTGEELWRHAHNAKKYGLWRVIPTPVIAGDLVCATLPRGGAVFAVRPGTNPRMDYEDAAWIYGERTTDVPSPAYHGGRLYIVNGVRKTLTCLDAATGAEVWQGKLGGSARIWASPTLADGKAYCLDERGQVTVAAIGDEFKVLYQVELGGAPCKSTIAIADGKLFIRTAEKLYCIGS